MYVLEELKPPSLVKFDGCIEPYEYIASINTSMTIIKAPATLKWKFLFGTSRDASLWWYMGLPQASIVNYEELVKKLVDQFAARRHRKMSTTSLFNIQWSHS